MTWIKTDPLKAGPLSNNWYNQDITGLTPSTTYQYRSYFIVDGVEYRGVNTYTATTSPNTYGLPVVITGEIVINVSQNGFDVMENQLISDGGVPIIEYGLLYTQRTAYGTNTTLIYDNYPTYVKKDSNETTISTPIFFSGSTSSLNAGRITYYRAYAKNAVGISYGEIYSQFTQLEI